MKLYTKTGDSGQTSLYGGTRVAKSSLRVESYGQVDELQASLGLVASFLDESGQEVKEIIEKIQYDTFTICSQLARPSQYISTEKDPVIKLSQVEWLEQHIDIYDAKLPVLRNFILQGGSKAGAHLHLARAISRRAERWVVALAAEEEVASEVVTYLNRLSDLLFVLARFVNHTSGIKEKTWKA